MKTRDSADLYDEWVEGIRLAGGLFPDEPLTDTLVEARRICERLRPAPVDDLGALTHLIGSRILAAYMVYLTSQSQGTTRDLRAPDEDRVQALIHAVFAMPDTLVATELETALFMSASTRTMVLRTVGV